MAEPLTEAELAQVRAVVIDGRQEMVPAHMLERLLATVEAYREIVQRVARGDLTTYRDREDEYCNGDPNCQWKVGQGQPIVFVHTPLCIVTRARALLGQEE